MLYLHIYVWNYRGYGRGLWGARSTDPEEGVSEKKDLNLIKT